MLLKVHYAGTFKCLVVAVAKWLTHRIVIPTYVGSIPISHPSFSLGEKPTFNSCHQPRCQLHLDFVSGSMND